MNGTPIVRGHTALIVTTVGILGIASMLSGAWLIFKGYQTGELLIQIGSNAVSGLLGFLGGKGMSSMISVSSDTAKATDATKTEGT